MRARDIALRADVYVMWNSIDCGEEDDDEEEEEEGGPFKKL